MVECMRWVLHNMKCWFDTSRARCWFSPALVNILAHMLAEPYSDRSLGTLGTHHLLPHCYILRLNNLSCKLCGILGLWTTMEGRDSIVSSMTSVSNPSILKFYFLAQEPESQRWKYSSPSFFGGARVSLRILPWHLHASLRALLTPMAVRSSPGKYKFSTLFPSAWNLPSGVIHRRLELGLRLIGSKNWMFVYRSKREERRERICRPLSYCTRWATLLPCEYVSWLNSSIWFRTRLC